jgi:hypothetical protein
MWDIHKNVPGWFGGETSGAGVHTFKDNAIFFHIDNPPGENSGFYRVGRIDTVGDITGWTGLIQIPDSSGVKPGWFGYENQGGSISIADLNNNQVPDLVVFHINHTGDGNEGYYRIGWDVNSHWEATNWTDPIRMEYFDKTDSQIKPIWFGNDNQGGSMTISDVNGNGRPDLIVYNIDHPEGGNQGWYRIGWDLDSNGLVKDNKWTDRISIPLDWGNESSAAGIAVGDIRHIGKKDLIIFNIDNPDGANVGYYRIGWDLGSDGKVNGRWFGPVKIGNAEDKLMWFGDETQHGSITLSDINRSGRPDLLVFHVDHREEGNQGWYRIGWDMDTHGRIAPR